MSIRKAKADDIDSLLYVETSSFKEPNTRLLMGVCGLSDYFYVYEDDDLVVGYALASPVNSCCARIASLAVSPPYRGMGIGSGLLSVVLDKLGREEFNEALLEVRVSNEGAISLYRSFGFEVNTRRYGYYNDGEDALEMTKRV